MKRLVHDGYSANIANAKITRSENGDIEAILVLDRIPLGNQRETVSVKGNFKIVSKSSYYYELDIFSQHSGYGNWITVMRNNDLRIGLGDPDSCDYIDHQKTN